MTTTETQRWRPYNDGGGRLGTVLVEPKEFDAEGNVTKYKVWTAGSAASMTWKAETLRRYFKPEAGA